MIICNAIQHEVFVLVYGPSDRWLFTKNGELYDFTQDAVRVRYGNMLYTYDANGHQVGSGRIISPFPLQKYWRVMGGSA